MRAAGSCWKEAIPYLLMVRKRVKEPRVDGELAYAYARVGDGGALEEFISGPHLAALQAVGDRLFDVRGPVFCFAACCLPLAARRLLLAACCSLLLAACCSLLAARCLLLLARPGRGWGR